MKLSETSMIENYFLSGREFMVELKQGDCIELMKDIPDGSVDMILCDLPYGTTACKWDNVIPFEPLWEQYKRVIKPNGAVVLFGSEPFSSRLRLSNLDMYKYDWKWEKNKGANFLNFKYQPAKVHEDIIVFSKMASSYSKNGNMNYFPQMESGKPYTQTSGKQKHDYGNSTVRTPIKQTVTKTTGQGIQEAFKDLIQIIQNFIPPKNPLRC